MKAKDFILETLRFAAVVVTMFAIGFLFAFMVAIIHAPT